MVNPPSRSAGVTAAATFLILQCIAVLGVWGYFLVNMANAVLDQQGHHIYELYPKAFALYALLPPLILAICVRTAIGLFELRPWARIGAMVWAVLALIACLWLIAFRPFETFVIPEHFVREIDSLRQLFAISFVFMLFPTSVWWLFLFRMKNVKAQFRLNMAEESSRKVAADQNGTIAPKAVI